MSNQGFTIDTPEGIEAFQLLRLRAALSLELKGLKYSRGSVYAHIKRTYNLRGNKQNVFNQFNELVEKRLAEINPEAQAKKTLEAAKKILAGA